MFRFVTFKCSCCDSVIFNLPHSEAEKLEGLAFFCECCNSHIKIECPEPEKISA